MGRARMILTGIGSPFPPPDAPPTVVAPGAIAYGSWAAQTAADVGLSASGNVLDRAYGERPNVKWHTIPDQTYVETSYVEFQALKLPTLANLKAGKVHGIKKVWARVDGGSAVDVPIITVARSERFLTSGSPDTTKNIGRIAIDPSLYADGRHELRLYVEVDSGEPLIMQGRHSEFAGIARFDQPFWSFTFCTNANGTLPTSDVYMSPSTGSDANAGTEGAPVQTFAGAIARIKALHGTADVGGGTIWLDHEGDLEFGHAGATAVPATMTAAASQYLTIRPKPGRTVRLTGSTTTGWGLRVQKLMVRDCAQNFTLRNRGSGSNGQCQLAVVGTTFIGANNWDQNAAGKLMSSEYGGCFVDDFIINTSNGAFGDGDVLANNGEIIDVGGDIFTKLRCAVDVFFHDCAHGDQDGVQPTDSHCDVNQTVTLNGKSDGDQMLSGIYGWENNQVQGFNTGNGGHNISMIDVRFRSIGTNQEFSTGGWDVNSQQRAYWCWNTHFGRPATQVDLPVDGSSSSKLDARQAWSYSNGFINSGYIPKVGYGWSQETVDTPVEYTNLKPGVNGGVANVFVTLGVSQRAFDADWWAMVFTDHAQTAITRAHIPNAIYSTLTTGWLPLNATSFAYERNAIGGTRSVVNTAGVGCLSAGAIPTATRSSGGVTPAQYGYFAGTLRALGAIAGIVYWGGSGTSASMMIGQDASNQITFRCGSTTITCSTVVTLDEPIVVIAGYDGSNAFLTVYTQSTPSGVSATPAAAAPSMSADGANTLVNVGGNYAGNIPATLSINAAGVEGGSVPAGLLPELKARAGIV